MAGQDEGLRRRAKELKRRSLAFVRLDGSMSHEKRVLAQENFKHPHVQVGASIDNQEDAIGLRWVEAAPEILLDPRSRHVKQVMLCSLKAAGTGTPPC